MCKAISEQLYISFAKQQQTTKVVMVRYGNVLESTGSVIPYFKSLLDNGSDFLPITHSDMTRFLLTLDEAVDLIDWSYHHKNSHGKIAVPKVKSMRVVDVAKSLIKSYGKNTTVEESTNFVKLKNIGIRSGEKLHEEMISTEEWLRTEDLENYLITSEIVNEEMWSYSSKNSVLTEKETYKFLSKSGVIN
jgi:FlaA1/EpsC-like NDP-sugar epimerase